MVPELGFGLRVKRFGVLGGLESGGLFADAEHSFLKPFDPPCKAVSLPAHVAHVFIEGDIDVGKPCLGFLSQLLKLVFGCRLLEALRHHVCELREGNVIKIIVGFHIVRVYLTWPMCAR